MPPLDELDDAALIARHLEGDTAAFGVLVTRHRDRAWAVALRTLGNPADAADAVQDAFVSAYRQAATFRGDARFSTWLHRVVVNACLDTLRRRRARPTTPLDETTAGALADPRDEMSQRELAHDVGSALRRLNDDQRAAILLVDVEGYPVEEAAALLGVPVGTVKSRCHRGRAQLAVLLGHLRPDRLPPGTVSVPGASQQQDHPNPMRSEP